MNNDFEGWLVSKKRLKASTVTTRVNNFKRIEKYYGSIELIINENRIDNLLEALTYSKKDEDLNRPKAHRIPIKGNKKDSIRKGTATLKQALQLYLQFLDSPKEHTNATDKKDLGKTTHLSDLKTIFDDLRNVLDQFNLSIIKESYSDNKHEVRDYIQLPLLWKLQDVMPSIDWKMEYKPSREVRDSIDIYGNVNDNTAIIIEIDTFRSDQISKKFVSRQALCKSMNLIYVVITYPNNNSNSAASQNEFDKFKNYLYDLTGLIMKGSGLDKYILIHEL